VPSFLTNSGSGILLDLSGPSGPAYARLAQVLRDAIRCGQLAAESPLPPSRTLAAELGCSRWVITEAYAQLTAEGYLTATVGSGTRVRDLAHEEPGKPRQAAPPRAAAAPAAPAAPIDMAPGLPDLRHFPMRQWMSALRAATAGIASADLAYPDPIGHPQLRQVLSDYLGRVRGARADPADMMITGGATDAIGLLCRVLKRQGHTAVAIEDPGWHRLRDVVTAAGLKAVPIPVDDEGLRADLLAGYADVRAVIVSPAHQFPVGVVLSPQRRALLLGWAAQQEGLIMEDDYDAEFRYDRRPVGALQGIGRSNVALIGSATKTLSPALGIGWVAIPPGWTALVRAAVVRSSGPPVFDQLAFAEFVRTGGYDRHLRATRSRYHTRRDGIVSALTDQLPASRISGIAAGLHLLVHLPPRTDAAAVVRRATAAGVRIANLDTYRFAAALEAPGLVVGYGNLADHQLQEGVARLAAAVRAHATG
jgi:GntR family transcriptional regulator/MocR family aminotransferase